MRNERKREWMKKYESNSKEKSNNAKLGNLN